MSPRLGPLLLVAAVAVLLVGAPATAVEGDPTPPNVSASVSGTSGDNGWYRSNVNVSWTVTDPESPDFTTSGCGDVTVSSDTGGQTITCTATSDGGQTQESVTVKVDKTAPSINGGRTPGPNGAGWNNENVAVTFSCSDGGPSGLASCQGNTTVSSQGANQSVTGTAKDNAGNTATDTVGGISIDKTAPSIGGSRNPGPNAQGWNNTNVTVSWDCSDGLSGIASCSGPTTFSSEGTGQSAAGQATDKAGNTANGSVGGINIDKTAPSISGSRSPAPNANGWNDENVTVSFSCSDGGPSGLDSCTGNVSVGEGANQSVPGTAKDKAGNTASTSVNGINVDKTPPSITAGRSPAPNANGWNNENVTVSYSCDDGLSGVASCPAAKAFTSEGAGQSASGQATDKAGNTATATVNGINIDKTAPSISGSKSPAPNANGWNNENVTVSFSCSDGGPSGIASCSGNVSVTSEGANQSVAGSATDKAGNTANATVGGISIDKTAPSVTGSRSPGPNANGWNNTDVTVSFSCSDGLSGVASCPAAATVTGEGAGKSATGSASDRAGNTTSATVGGINIDKTPPTITGSRTPPPDLNGWNNTDVTVSFACSDGTSGIASCTDPTTVTTEGVNQSVSGQTADRAGNDATATVSGISIDKTPPSLFVPDRLVAEATGPGGAPVAFTVTASDGDEALPPDAISCAPPSGSHFGLGNTGVTCRATDLRSNAAERSFDVSVRDSTGPAIFPPATLTVVATSTEGIERSAAPIAALLSGAIARDLVDPAPSLSSEAPERFPIGVTRVRFVAVDRSGNRSEAYTAVTVVELGTGRQPGQVISRGAERIPPSDPATPGAKPGPGYVLLSWRNPPESDFDRVEIYRSEQLEAVRTIQARSAVLVYKGRGTWYRDRAVEGGVQYRYTIVSVDKAGNRSLGAVVVALPQVSFLLAPREGVVLGNLPLLRWKRPSGATYYNLQLFRGNRKVLTAWPRGNSFRVPFTWRFEGRPYRLSPGLYRWYLWPGIGSRAKVRYGLLMGFRTFRITQNLSTLLVAGVGPRSTITVLRLGQKARALKRGTYTIVVRDRSRSLNFELRGPGVRRTTGVRFVGTVTWKVKLRRGVYVYRSVPGRSLRGTIRVR